MALSTAVLALIAVGTIVAYYWIFFIIYLSNMERRKGQERTVSDYTRELATLLFALIFLIPLLLITVVTGLARNISSAWPIFVGLAGLTLAADAWVQFGTEIVEAYDMVITQFWVPFYRFGVMTVAEIVRIFYDITICLWNLFNNLSRIFLEDAALIAVNDCGDFVDWRVAAQAFVDMLEAPFIAAIEFIASDGLDPYDGLLAFEGAAEVLASTLDLLSCYCEDASLLFAWLKPVIRSANLHNLLNNILNLTADMLRPGIVFLVELFSNLPTPFSCPSAAFPITSECQLNRPPKLDRLFDNFIQSSKLFGFWIDDIIDAVLDNFFGFSSGFTPSLTWYFGALIGFPLRIVEFTIDVLVHIDLVFTDNYLSLVDMTKPNMELFCISAGFADFWQGISDGTGVPQIARLGTGFAQIANASIEITILQTRVTQVLLTNPANTITFAVSYDYAPITDQWRDGWADLASFASFVNPALGDIVEYFYKTMSDVMIFLFQVMINVQTLIVGTVTEVNDLDTDILSPIITQYFEDSRRLSAANGNFFRQFGKFDPVAPCPEIPLIPTPIGVTGGALDTELFCCLGNFVHSYSLIGFEVSYLFFEFFGLVIDLRAGSISLAAFGVILNDFADNMERLVERVDDLIDSFGCALVFPFYYAECPNSDILTDLDVFDSGQTTIPLNSDRLSNFFRRPISAYFNATLRPFIRGPAVLIFALRDLNNCGYGSCTGGEITDIICYIIVSTYDLTVAAFIEIFFSVWNIVACLIPGTPPGTEVWSLFGWDGVSMPPGPVTVNLRDELCRVIDAVLRVAQFLVNVFNSASGFFTEAIDFLESLFVDGIEAAFTLISTQIAAAISVVVDDLLDAIDDLRADAQAALNVLVSAINAIIIQVNRLLCFASGLPGQIGLCFNIATDNSAFNIDIDINPPGINVDSPGLDLHLNIDEHFNIPIPNPGAFTDCLDNLDILTFAGCPAGTLSTLSPFVLKRQIPLASTVVIRHRKDFDLIDYTMYEQNGHLTPSKAAKRGDPEGVVLFKPPLDSQLAKELPDYEYLLQPNITWVPDEFRIHRSSPCYAMAMYVMDGIAPIDPIDHSIQIEYGANETNAFEYMIEQSLGGLYGNDSSEKWGRLAHLDELQWCLTKSAAIHTVNNIFNLSNDTKIPEDFLSSPVTTLYALYNLAGRLQSILYYQLYKSDIVPEILTLNRSSSGHYIVDNSTDIDALVDEQVQYWFQWAAAQNITDTSTLRWGGTVDCIRILYDLLNRNLISEQMGALSEIWKFARTFLFDLWVGVDDQPGIVMRSYDALAKASVILDEDNAPQRQFLWEYLSSFFAQPFYQLSEANQAYILQRKQAAFDFLYEKTQTSDPAAIQRRHGMSHIKSRIMDAFYLNAINRGATRSESDPVNYVVRWARREHPEEVYQRVRETEGYRNTKHRRDRLEEDIFFYKQARAHVIATQHTNRTAHILESNHERRLMGVKDVFAHGKATFGGAIPAIDLDPCIAGACLRCILLDVLIDRVVFEICDCIEALLDTVTNAFDYTRSLTGVWGGDPSAVPFPSTFPPGGVAPAGYGLPLMRHDGSVFYPEDEPLSGNSTIRGVTSAAESRQSVRNFFSEAIARISNIEILPTPFNLNIFIKNLILAIPRLLIGNFDYDSIRDSIVSFFTQTDFASKDSFYFYLRFLLGCRSPNYKCDVTEDVGEGVGLASAIGTVLITLIVASFVLPRLVPGGGQLVLIAWSMAIALMLIFAYRWTPSCGFIMPDCAADDGFDIMAYFDVDCTPWHVGLPGMTTPICPTSSENFQRTFVDCSKPPYNYNDGIRNVATLIELYFPEFNAYFLRTGNLLFVLFRDIDYFRNAATFPFESGKVPDTYQSCNKFTALNYAGVLTLAIFSGSTLALLALGLWQLFSLLVALLTLLLEMLISVVDQSRDPDNENLVLTEKSPEMAAIAQAEAVSNPGLNVGSAFSRSSMRRPRSGRMASTGGEEEEGMFAKARRYLHELNFFGQRSRSAEALLYRRWDNAQQQRRPKSRSSRHAHLYEPLLSEKTDGRTTTGIPLDLPDLADTDSRSSHVAHSIKQE